MPRDSTAFARRWTARGYDRLVVYADREHSANLAWLTGFDPRFEEAIARRRPGRRAGDPRRQRVLRDGRRRAAADAPRPVPGPQPAGPAARSLATAGRDPRRGGDRAGRAGSGSSAGRRTPSATSMDAPAFLVDELRAADRAAGLVENATDLLIDAGRRPAGHQRGRAAGRARVRRLPDLERRPSRPAPGCARDDRARGRPPARLGRDAAVVPPDADRRTAGDARAAQPGRPADRARRPVHRRVRDLGRARTAAPASSSRMPTELPAGDRRLRRPARRRPTSRPSRSGTARSASARPAARCSRSSSATSATRSSGSSSTPGTRSASTNGSTRRSRAARRSSSGPGWRSRSTSSRPPGPTTSRRTSRTASRSPMRSLRAAFAAGYPGGLGADRGAPAVHGAKSLGIDLHPDVLPFSNLRRLPAAVPAPTRPRDDDRGRRQRPGLSRSGGTSQRSVPPPAASGRSMSIRAIAPFFIGTSGAPAQLREELARSRGRGRR